MDELSLAQAYEIVRLHLSEPDGLISQLERGVEINNEQVRMLEYAIEKIHLEWKNVSTVPKHVVSLFHNIFYRLSQIILIYPQREIELHTLYGQFALWLDKIFAEEPLSEEGAIAIVTQQIFGLEPLSLELRFRNTINEGSLELLLVALDSLSVMWKSKDQVSKLAAGAMLNAQEMFTDMQTSSVDSERQSVMEASQQILTRIDQCLH